MSLILAILTAALSVLLIGQISDIYKRQVYKNIFLENVNKLNPEGQEINFNILITDAMRGVFEELKAKGVGLKTSLQSSRCQYYIQGSLFCFFCLDIR